MNGHIPPAMTKIGQRVRALRNGLGLNQAKLGELVGADQSTVSRWETNRGFPESDHLIELAKLANTTVNDFLGKDGAEVRFVEVEDIRVIGKVEAGEWIEAVELPSDEQFTISVVPHAGYRNLRKYALQVVGPSMNLEYPDGALVVCVDLVEAQHELANGDHIVVERLRGDGKFEVTVKEYSRQPDGTEWAIPRSSDPRYGKPYPLSTSPDAPDVEHVRALALVIGSYKHRVKL